jgi:peptide/nickel transport system permease protein
VTGFVLRRLLSTAAVLFALSILVFLIFFATPGIDPARQIAGRSATPETLATVTTTFGLDRPLPVQYWRLMRSLVIDRDLESYTNRGVKVLPELAAAAPVTLSLVLGAAVLWIVLSIAFGVISARWRNGIWDRIIMIGSLVSLSVPVFWLGQVVNLLTQSTWHSSPLFSWLPPLGYTPLTEDPVLWFKHLVIPWLVLAATYIGLYSRIFRSSLIETSGQDFVRTARAKGLSEPQIERRHLVRPSLGTFASLFALDFGALVAGGALLAEVVFGLPGIGRLTYLSLTGLDLPVIMAAVLYGGAIVVVMNMVVDVLYAQLDPRVRAQT